MFFSFFAECHSQVESQCVCYAAGVNDVESVNPVVPIPTVENTGTLVALWRDVLQLDPSVNLGSLHHKVVSHTQPFVLSSRTKRR